MVLSATHQVWINLKTGEIGEGGPCKISLYSPLSMMTDEERKAKRDEGWVLAYFNDEEKS